MTTDKLTTAMLMAFLGGGIVLIFKFVFEYLKKPSKIEEFLQNNNGETSRRVEAIENAFNELAKNNLEMKTQLAGSTATLTEKCKHLEDELSQKHSHFYAMQAEVASMKAQLENMKR